jgi:DNA-binding transcriptional ArsR family regulator
MSAVFDALAAPRRREILRLVWDRERSAGEIHRSLSGVSFGAVSQHLAVLESAGLVGRRNEGRFHYYAARRGDLGHLGKWLEEMWDVALADLKRHAEAEERSQASRAARGSRRKTTPRHRRSAAHRRRARSSRESAD